MTLSRKATWSILATLVSLGLNQILILAQTVQLLYWPALILRIFVMLSMGPALIFVHWSALHWGVSPPLPICLVLLWMVYLTLGMRIKTRLESPPSFNRRAFLVGAGTVTAVSCGASRLYPAPEMIHHQLPLKNLPDSLVGLRVALLSDLHRGPVISREYLESVVSQVNALKPDLVLMPGDFVSRSDRYFPDLTEVLSKFRPTIASLATLGNHDNWEGTESAKQAITRAGVLLLHNRSVVLNSERQIVSQANRGLCLAGVDDLGSGKPDLGEALRGVGSNLPRLLMSHNPDLAEDESALALNVRVDLQLSGHTHGGQIVLPGIGPLVSGSRHGLKYISGWAEGPQWPVFVTRGVGTSIVPFRVGANPEIVVFTLSSRSEICPEGIHPEFRKGGIGANCSRA